MPGQDIVIKLESIPLTGMDLIQISSKMGNSNVDWILYDDLANVKSLDELFSGDNNRQRLNSIFVLLQIRNSNGIESVGHWICLIDQISESGETIIYYDPYGLSINEDLVITKEPDLLSRLLKGKKVDISHFRHQNIKNETQVCGRHCCLRAIFHFLSNKDYNDDIMMPPIKNKEVKDADIMISLITGLLSKSDEVVKKIVSERIIPEKKQTRITRDRDRFKGLGGSAFG